IGLCLCEISGEKKSPLIFLEESLVLYGWSEKNSCKLLSDDSFFAEVIASESNTDFQKNLIHMDGKSETSQQMRSSKKSNVAANESDDTPAAPRVRKYLDNAAVKNILEKIRIIVQKKQKRDNNAGRASCKRKLENNEDVAVKKEETMLETSNQSIPTDLSHIPQKSLVDIEMELVYTDEEDISFEFAEPVAPTSTGSAPCGSEKENALRAPNDSALPQVDKQLQTTLQEASTCYREENYTAAAEQFSTALELCGNGAAIDNPSESSPEDISSIASFIESKLVTCYLKLKKPDDALNHSH
ncbi:PREDICTED: spermatogenesis-associated protein 16-like, partial [Chlamydotis macqueenii]|uniref:spermatogenesis-associated protein 16-like n=1 Tax=Chlamydotis macqueenii TaxID=187382 RepID=UPI000529D732